MGELIVQKEKPTAWGRAWWLISLQWKNLSKEQRVNLVNAKINKKPKPSSS